MLTSTPAYQIELTTETKARDLYGKIEFRQLDTDAYADCTPTATSTETISSPSNLNNEVDNPAINYATLETDRWVLDGRFKLLPDSSYQDMGWWSKGDNLSHATLKTFTPNITVTRTFTSNHSSVGITIFFDVLNDEYAEEFDVKYYDSGNNLIETITETTNSESYYVNDTAVANYRKVEIVIKKWSHGDRRARISEVLPGLSKVYSKSNGKLIYFKQDEELDVTVAKVVPAVLDFSVDNSDLEYDILNPSGIYAFLQKTQEINAYIGAVVGGSIEYVSLGKFFLEDWKTNQNALEAKFSAVDTLGLMEKKTYYKGLKQSITLYDLAEDVLQDYGLTSADYNIDASLSTITTTNFLPICNYKEALQHIAVTGHCLLYVDRDGIIQLKPVNTTSSGLTVARSGQRQPTPDISLARVVKQVDIDITTITTAGSTSDVAKSTVTINGTQDIWVIYDKPASSVSASVSAGAINSAEYYSNACLLNITAAGTITITVTGSELTLTASIYTKTSGESDGEVIGVKSPLVSSSTIADAVGTYMVARYAERTLLTTEWRGNPALILDDLVDIETHFSTPTDMRVIKQSYEYNGGLKSRLEVKG